MATLASSASSHECRPNVCNGWKADASAVQSKWLSQPSAGKQAQAERRRRPLTRDPLALGSCGQAATVALVVRKRLIRKPSTIAISNNAGTSPVRWPFIIGLRIDSQAMIPAWTTLDQTTNQISEAFAAGFFAARI